MEKFNRNYVVSVEAIDGTIITIQPPFTLEFDVARTISSSQNHASLRIYNLAAKTRNRIRKDWWDFGDNRFISVRAGYGENMPLLFLGTMTSAWSVREGNNFITQIECMDAGYGFANSPANFQFADGTTRRAIIETLITAIPGVSVGAIGDGFDEQITRGNSYSGAAPDILREITGGGFFVDNGKGYCLANGEAINGPIALINSASGLLGTPQRQQFTIVFDMLFEPNLIVGQIIKLESITGENFNRIYRVDGVKHRGMISEAVCGNAITGVTLFSGPGSFQVIG